MRNEKIIGGGDIGGTKIAVGAVTQGDENITRMECATVPEEGFELSIQRTKGILRAAAPRAGTEIECVGIACPGPLDPHTEIVGERRDIVWLARE